MIDTHCHPQFPEYENDRKEIIDRALADNVGMICVGTDFEMSQKAIDLAKKYEKMWASIGLHPNDNLEETFDADEYYKLGKNEKIVAFGEIGLDYYRTPDPEKQNIQKKRFFQQIQIASELSLPLIIHCRDAYKEMHEILKQNRSTLRNEPGVIHSFTGKWQEAEVFIDLGFYIGLNGIITFTDQYNETVAKTPLDKILLETDAPLLSPVPNRGKRNEPSYLKYIAEKIAEIRKIGVNEIEKTTTENAIRLFNLE